VWAWNVLTALFFISLKQAFGTTKTRTTVCGIGGSFCLQILFRKTGAKKLQKRLAVASNKAKNF